MNLSPQNPSPPQKSNQVGGNQLFRLPTSHTTVHTGLVHGGSLSFNEF